MSFGVTINASGSGLPPISLRGGDIVTQLEQTGSRITETIVERSDKVTETFSQSAEALASSIGSRGDAVRDMLGQRLQAFEEMFNTGGAELAERSFKIRQLATPVATPPVPEMCSEDLGLAAAA